MMANNYRELGQQKIQKNVNYDNAEVDDGKKAVPQRKPKNPLAFQNPVPIVNQNQNQVAPEKK